MPRAGCLRRRGQGQPPAGRPAVPPGAARAAAGRSSPARALRVRPAATMACRWPAQVPARRLPGAGTWRLRRAWRARGAVLPAGLEQGVVRPVHRAARELPGLCQQRPALHGIDLVDELRHSQQLRGMGRLALPVGRLGRLDRLAWQACPGLRGAVQGGAQAPARLARYAGLVRVHHQPRDLLAAALAHHALLVGVGREAFVAQYPAHAAQQPPHVVARGLARGREVRSSA